MRRSKLPLLASLLIIFASTLLVSGSATAGWLYYRRWQRQRCCDPHFLIRNISQQTPHLPDDLLAQLMGLTPNHNLYTLDTHLLENRLTASPLIEHATITRTLPDTLTIDYTPTRPVARLAEFPAYGIDAHGQTLPLIFYTGETLPELYLDAPTLDDLPAQPLKEALALLDSPLPVEWIDTSQILAKSCGRRQIVLIVEQPPHHHILRVDPRHTSDALRNYSRLELPAGDLVIDLRLRQLAFISVSEFPCRTVAVGGDSPPAHRNRAPADSSSNRTA